MTVATVHSLTLSGSWSESSRGMGRNCWNMSQVFVHQYLILWSHWFECLFKRTDKILTFGSKERIYGGLALFNPETSLNYFLFRKLLCFTARKLQIKLYYKFCNVSTIQTHNCFSTFKKQTKFPKLSQEGTQSYKLVVVLGDRTLNTYYLQFLGRVGR